MLLLRHLLLLVLLAGGGRADYKWTGTEWVYVEPNRDKTDPIVEGSGNNDDEDYYDDDDYYNGGGNTGIFEPAQGGGSSDTTIQHGGLDSSKFNFERPGISDDEDFYDEGSGYDGDFGDSGGSRDFRGPPISGGLPIDADDSEDFEGSGGDVSDSLWPTQDGGLGGLTPGRNQPSYPVKPATSSTPQAPNFIEDPYDANNNNNRPSWPVDSTDYIYDDDDDDFYKYDNKNDFVDSNNNRNNNNYFGGDERGNSNINDFDLSPTYDDSDISIDVNKPPSKSTPPYYPTQAAPVTPPPPTPRQQPPIVVVSSTRRPHVVVPDGGQSPPAGTDVPTNRPVSFFAQPGILAAVIGGAVVGLLCAILLVMFIVYRMRKKDEGSYILDEPKRVHNGNVYTKTPNREFYA